MTIGRKKATTAQRPPLSEPKYTMIDPSTHNAICYLCRDRFILNDKPIGIDVWPAKCPRCNLKGTNTQKYGGGRSPTRLYNEGIISYDRLTKLYESNATRAAAGMSQIPVRLRKCLSCRDTIESLGSRRCGPCQRLAANYNGLRGCEVSGAL